MTNRHWISEANNYLRCKYSGLHKKLDPTLPVFKPGLTDWESKCFLLGMEQGLFAVDYDGHVQTCFLPLPKSINDIQKTTQLFNHIEGGKRMLSRENFCHLATVSSLVIFREWEISQIKMEPAYRVNRSLLSGSVDIAIESTSGKVLVGCEIKSSQREHEKLIRDFKYCCERGQHGKEDCPKDNRNNHPKYNFCNHLQPNYFFAVSPEKEQCFELKYCSDKILLKEITTLPDRKYIDTPN